VVTAAGRHVEALPFPTDAGAACLLRDVTDRVEREAALRRQVDRLDEFAGAVAHDLRNPLTVAMGRLELLAESAAVDADDENLRAVRAALERADDLVDGALRFARESSVEDPVPTDPATVAERAWSTAATGRARLETRPVGRVLADPEALRRLFENLCRNAVEHGATGNRTDSGDAVEHGATVGQTGSDDAAGGDPVDGAPTVRVGPCAEGTGFHVSDDGPGIPAPDRERVFDRSFSSGDGGLGLAVVAEVARAHGWSVRATESETGGARFEVTGLTRAPESPAPASSRTGVADGGAARSAED
jgi:signal transduction histidine kinase